MTVVVVEKDLLPSLEGLLVGLVSSCLRRSLDRVGSFSCVDSSFPRGGAFDEVGSRNGPWMPEIRGHEREEESGF